MADVVNMSRFQGLLVDRRRRQGVHFLSHGQVNGFFDVFKSGAAGQRLHFTDLQLFDIHIVQVDNVDHAKFILAILRIFHTMDAQLNTAEGHSLLQHGHIANHQGTAGFVDFGKVQGFHNNFRTHAGGIAHRHGNNRFLHSKQLLKIK